MIVLERFTQEDFQRLISWIEDKESLIEFAGAYFQYPLSEDQLQRYISDEKKMIFRVKESDSEKIIGHAEIFKVEKEMVRLCRVLIGEKKFRGRGIGQEIIRELTNLSFDLPQIELVELNVYERNIPAIRCYEKVGFRMNPAKNKISRINEEDWKSLNMVMNRKEWSKNQKEEF